MAINKRASNNAWFNVMLPYAQQVKAKTGVPVSVLLAQWAHESASATSNDPYRGVAGRSNVAMQANNYAGIGFNQYSKAAGSLGVYAKYSSPQQFVQDYIRVINLPYYSKVRSAGTVQGAVAALAASPWAGSHYYGGKALTDWITGYDLTRFDGAPTKK